VVAGEDIGVGLEADKRPKVMIDFRLDVRWNRDAASTRVRLGRSGQQPPIHIDDLLSDLYPLVQHIQVGPPKCA
jgi:hypothetical protein